MLIIIIITRGSICTVRIVIIIRTSSIPMNIRIISSISATI